MNTFGTNNMSDGIALESMLKMVKELEPIVQQDKRQLPMMLYAITPIADIYIKYRLHREAESWLRRELDIKIQLKTSEEELQKTKVFLGMQLMEQEKFAESETMLLQSRDYFVETTPRHIGLSAVYDALVKLYNRMGQYNKTLEIVEEVERHLLINDFSEEEKKLVSDQLKSISEEAKKKIADKAAFLNFNMFKED